MSEDRARQLVEAGLWLRLSGDNEGAQRLFEQALRLDPGNQKARQYLEMGRQGLPTPMPIAPQRTPTANPFERRDPPGAHAPPQDWPTTASPVTPRPRAPRAAANAWDTDAPPGISLPAGAARRNDPLDLVTQGPQGAGASPPPVATPLGAEQEVETLLRGVQDLLELDDHTGVMDLLAKAQELAPRDPKVQAMREHSERTLLAMLESKLGDLLRVPRVRLQNDDIIWLNLDHRAGFVLAQVDGSVSYEDLFSVSGMTRLDTARILVQLLDEGVITAD